MGKLAASYPLPRSSYAYRRHTTGVAVHCADTKPSQDVGVATIRKWHVEERGWMDVGYHLVIRRSGKVEMGRPIEAIGAHVEHHNSETVGVCLVGGMGESGGAENNFTPAQMVSLRAVLKMLTIIYPTITTIQGHRDFPGVTKYCPSFDVREWLEANPL